MSDAFFNKPRPFTKRKREDGPASSSRHGTSSRGTSLVRGGRGSSRGRGGSSRGAPGASRGGASRGGRGGARGGRGGGAQDNKGKRRAEQDEELDIPEVGGAFDSDSGGELEEEEELDNETEEEDELETPAQKRLRLSQMYLKSLEKETVGTLDERESSHMS